MRRFTFAAVIAAASVLVLSGCATGAYSPAGLGAGLPDPPEPPKGEVIGQGTVLDDGESVELCLGPVAESYPPQCSGIPIEGWNWDGLDGSESASGVTWGAYAVQGTYDGQTFTVTQPPIMLALYDPMVMPDPTDGATGAGTEAELVDIQESLPSALSDAYLASYPENGWLWVDVVWDDGTIQDAVDAEYGQGVVVVRSALREVG